MEDEIKFGSFKDWQPHAGKTGKGLLHFYSSTGQYRCIDAEDVISVSVTSRKTKR